jgi:hypothetical protein
VAQKPRPSDNVFTLFSDDAELAEEASFGRKIVRDPPPAPQPGQVMDDRGAVELRMPRLPVAKKIENRRLQFRHARDSYTPEGRKVVPLGWSDRISLQAWLAAMDGAMAPIGSWIP